jgi:DNA replication and repair protein RecF
MAPVRLTALSLAQFRSWTRAELALDGRPVALFGPNGAGKTNLLEAVSLLSPGRGLRRARADALARAPGPHGWRVRAEAVVAGLPREVTLTGDPQGRRRVEIDGKSATQTALGRLAAMLWLTPAMDRLWIEGAEGRRRWLDRCALSFFPDHADAALAYDRAMRERNRLLRDGPADPAWLTALEARMAVAGVSMACARAAAVARLRAAPPPGGTLFPTAEIAIVGDMERRLETRDPDVPPGDADLFDMQADFAAALARCRAEDAAAGRALHGPHRSDLTAVYAAKGMEARLCSTGEQKALLIALTLANARALAQDGAAPILLLDEVAAHLDAGRRAALFDELCALGGQSWMTGVGPELFAELGDRAQRFAVAEEPAGSTAIMA